MGKLYDALTPEERFRVTIKALGRDDAAEVERLHRGCPRKTYTMADAGFADRLEASDVLTSCVLVELASKLAKLRMIEAMGILGEYLEGLDQNGGTIAYLEGFQAGGRAAWQAAKRRGEPPSLPVADADLADVTARAAEMRATYDRIVGSMAGGLAAEARGTWDGFGRFCRDELNLAPEEVIAAWARPALTEIEHFRPALDAAEPEPTNIEALAAVLRYAWRCRALGDPASDAEETARQALEAADEARRSVVAHDEAASEDGADA